MAEVQEKVVAISAQLVVLNTMTAGEVASGSTTWRKR
jgi:hypothetical protein